MKYATKTQSPCEMNEILLHNLKFSNKLNIIFLFVNL
jgi:hypothetical protein